MPDDAESVERSTDMTRTDRQRPRDLAEMLSPAGQGFTVEITEDHILSILRARRGREETMGAGLFSDPAWDILLELYAARLGSRRMSVPELARSIDTPQSTTVRWIAILSDRGLVTTITDFGDATKLWIELSSKGDAAMRRILDKWGSAFHSIGQGL